MGKFCPVLIHELMRFPRPFSWKSCRIPESPPGWFCSISITAVSIGLPPPRLLNPLFVMSSAKLIIPPACVKDLLSWIRVSKKIRREKSLLLGDDHVFDLAVSGLWNNFFVNQIALLVVRTAIDNFL